MQYLNLNHRLFPFRSSLIAMAAIILSVTIAIAFRLQPISGVYAYLIDKPYWVDISQRKTEDDHSSWQVCVQNLSLRDATILAAETSCHCTSVLDLPQRLRSLDFANVPIQLDLSKSNTEINKITPRVVLYVKADNGKLDVVSFTLDND